MQKASTRSYRCSYHPLEGAFAALCDSGVLPFVQVQAQNAEEAQRLAYHITGCAISDVQRLDQSAARFA
ncbi:hypothetical protein ASE08_05205 [Rhizobacter sp. Root16D2]|nr:hypothetical protein ASE08_05205 [Rhizobacter sp. Root16D2]